VQGLVVTALMGTVAGMDLTPEAEHIGGDGTVPRVPEVRLDEAEDDIKDLRQRVTELERLVEDLAWVVKALVEPTQHTKLTDAIDSVTERMPRS
jgi:hypothetical protein